MANARKRRHEACGRREKTVDETIYLSGRRRGAILKQEVWSEAGEVVKYSLAYMDLRFTGVDNGRVLGYDSSHGHHHRHFRGEVEEVDYAGYEAVLLRFRQEVEELWRQEDETR
ncbi:MAG: hypothetical protein WA655_13130 [Candidatus Korobacteraceae bacterium]